ncbi:Calx-beta domain-containing protein [Nostoc punctiforme UO1]|uniref:Calx-beta domain-containing protein n=1 Tax=Nostoc punctiforme TaxID=272131 RepID=UPI0030A99DBA
MSIAGTTDKITINYFFYTDNPANQYNPLQQVTFNDGTVWNLATLVAKALSSTDGNDSINGTNADDTLSGGLGNDSINGVGGNDTLSGVNPNNINPGIGERDSLSGGSGSDRFILGDNANIYYDDRNITTNGSSDYATITDFNPSADKVQLQGTATNYRLETSSSNTNLYIDQAGSEPDELIAVFQNVTGLNLTSSAFEYISPVNAFAFSSGTYSVNETGTAQITIIRTGSLVGQVSVTLISTNGTAQAPSDYNNAPISIIFNDGENSKTVTIPIVDDTAFEVNETISLALSNPSDGFNLGGQNTATLTIIDNDTLVPGTLAFSTATYSINEDGTSVVAVTLTRTGGSDLEVSATIVLSNGTANAGEDYNNQNIVVILADKETSKTVNIPIINDTVYEPTETVNLTLSNPTGGAILGTQKTATLNIVDNDGVAGTIQFNNTAYSINENGTPITAVTLTRTGGSDGAVSVRVNLTNGTAIAGSDYTNTPITVTFANGETSKTVTIPIVNDAIAESNETINLTLANPQGGATLGTQTTAILTIIDNDQAKPGTLAFSQSSFTVNEDGTPVTVVTVSRTDGSDGAVGVIVNLINGSAIAPNDYSNTAISVNFTDGETSKTVTIPIANDALLEGNETINLSLTNPTGGAILGTQQNATLVIIDNDIQLAFANSTFTVNEDGTPINQVTVVRSGLTSTAVSATIELSDGTATTPSDYTNTSITVTFVAGETSKTVAIPIINDLVLEARETVNLTLTNPTGGATLGTQNTATLNIVDNDIAPGIIQFGNANYSINENGIPVTAITLTRSGGSDGAVGVRVNLSNGTANAGSDYTNSSIQVDFADGESIKTVTIPIIDDAIVDPDQTINLTLSNATGGATIGIQNIATVKIVDNDSPRLSLALNKENIYEGETATGTITRNTEDTSSELVITLASSDTTEATVPQTVTIPVNQSSVNFTLTGVTDNLSDSSQTAIITASATGFENGTKSIAINNNDLPDLVVSNIVAPSTAQSGQKIDITWTLTNQGNLSASGTWSDRVYLSDNETIGNDLQLGTFAFTGTIAPGASINRTQSVILPLELSGDRKIVVQTDILNQISERNGTENNNSSIDDKPITVSLSPYANLKVASVTAPTTAFSSQETVVKWVVTNTGNGNTNTPLWYDRVWLSLDQNFDSSDIYLGQAANPSYLNVGESYSNQLTVTLPTGVDSNYYFLVKTDATNQVWEFDKEGDNFNFGNPTDVDLTPPPDLQVTSVNASSPIFSGQKINLNWTVGNKGEGRTFGRYWYDDIYLSLDKNIDPKTDYYLGRQQYNSFALFESGASYTESKQVEIPIGISGDFYFLVKTDAGNYVFEQAFEENNTGSNSTPIEVKLPPPPDLEVDFVDVPASATASRPITINYRVTNYGSTRTPNSSWVDSFYLSADANLDIDTDYKLGDRTRSGALNANESFTSSAVFTLPDTLTGTYYVFAVTDSTNQVFELDNANNTNFDNQIISITSHPADLIVSAVTTPETGENGKLLRINWTVRNQGIGDTAVSNWNDRIIASKDNILGNNDDILLGDFSRNGLLNVGGSYSRSELVTIPFTFGGNYNLFVVADSNQNVYEANQENNNSSSAIPLSVIRQTPDLQVTQVAASTTATSGQPFTVSWKVENLGGNTTNSYYWYDEVFLSTDQILNEGDISLEEIYQYRSLPPSNFYQSSRTFTLPVDIQGNYYILVNTDNRNIITEDALENNNIGVTVNPTTFTLSQVPDLVVSNITAPTQAVSGQALELTWTVNNAGANTNGNWRDFFYLSRDQIFDAGNDIYIGFVADQGGLSTQQNYTKTNSFTLPRGLSGDYYILGITDANNNVYERSGEANNVTFNNTPIQIVAPIPTDLVAGTITIPNSGTPGLKATITYTIQNQGFESAIGTWQDSIYISADDRWDINDPLFTQVDVSGPLNSGNSYSKTVTANLPGVPTGDYHVIIRSDIRNVITESNDSNNLKVSLNQFEVDVESLTLGTPVKGYFISKGLTEEIAEITNIVSDYGVSVLTSSGGTLAQESIYYKVDVAAGETLRLKLDGSTGVATFDPKIYNVLEAYPVAIEGSTIYVRYGDVPTPAEFDYSFSQGLLEDQEIVIPSTQAGTYYILAAAPQLQIIEPETNNSPTRSSIFSISGGGGGGGGIEVTKGDPRPVVLGIGLPSYSLKAEIIEFSIQDISTKQGSNRGQVTMAIEGAKFTPDGVISLIANDGTVRNASKVWWKDSTEMWATFDLQGLGTGLYDVRIQEDGKTALANDIFTVTNGAVGKLETQLITPAALRPGISGIITVNYANTGETDIVAPLLRLETKNANLVLANQTGSSTSIQFLGIDDEGPAGIIEPGESGSFSVKFDPTINNGSVNFYLSQASNDQTINWSDLKESSQPLNIPDDAWDLIWNNFVAEVGNTAGDYQALLAANANQLSQIGDRTNDISDLLSFELQQASYNQLGQILTSAIDASSSTSGLDLSFGRSYHQSLDGRLTIGILGRGWTNTWDVTATTVNEDVVIQNGGSDFTFTKLTDGSYQSPEGIYASLTREDGNYRLRQQDGTILSFRNDGKLNYFEDTDSNRITANYVDGQLTSLNPSNGSGFTLVYNSQGRLSELTDAAGRKTTYTYDLSGEYLLSVTGVDGTISYSYETTLGNSQHALKSITFPDNTHSYFDYDTQGRLIKERLDGNAQSVTYTYDENGGIAVTDANGISTQILLNNQGLIARSQDALQRLIQYQYDNQGNITKLITPDNTAFNYTYDSRNNLLSSTNALGQKTQFTYEPNFDYLQSVKDPKGNPLSYKYDTKGNITGITYADGSSESFSFDAVGNVSVSVNRRNQTINYTYNNQGLLTRKDFTDGTSAIFAYDNRGNLLSGTDSDSSVSYTYDNADRLTKVTYDESHSLSFTYDAGGRRTSMTDQDGFAVNYIYDNLGQLKQLTNGTDANIVSYSYDNLGRLVKEDNGNGTYTTYSYDVVDQLLSLVNYKADNTVNSRYDYVYDVMGRRTSMTTLEGTTNYSYDAIGQLTGVNLPNGRIIQYRYDDAGNRISVTDNGVGTNYSTNNLNQYTSAGAASYTYDTDGNLISKQQGSNTWNYSYDSENRLVKVTSTEGTWNYKYDALGNRIATIHNGQRTEYIVDPTGLGDVIGEYDGTGSLIANYTHGLGLVSRFDGSNESYYDADAIGSIVGLTGNSGSYLNQYSYLPFGEDLTKVETISNSFEYVGQWGVMDEGNGLTFMRARYYDSNTGKFTSPDPIGLHGGDVNQYRYVFNNSVIFLDPSGNRSMGMPGGMGAVGGAAGTGGVSSTGGLVGAVVVGAIGAVVGGAIGAAVGGVVAGGVGLAFGPGGGLYGFFAGAYYGGAIGEAAGGGYGAYLGQKIGEAAEKINLPNLPNLPNLGGDPFTGLPWPGTGIDDASTRIVRPSDPNDIIGPEGFGQEKWIPATSTLPYTIRFENQATATAPAQKVTIIHPLDSDLDVRTFRLGDFGWSGITFDVPNNVAFYSQRLDLTATKGFFVDVAAGVDVANKEAFWIITTIDPKTGEIPTDPSIGFLPPDNEQGIGDGFVNYTIRPSRNATTATVIDAKATIVFDNEAPIDTPPIFNTLDVGKPSSSVEVLPNLVNNPEFLLKWSGNDDENGSGIASYDVYVSENGGNFTLWLDDTTLTEAPYLGQYGKTYAFYTVAVDNVGNIQTTPTIAQATTQVANSTVNQSPILAINNGLTLNEAATATINLNLLQVTDADNSPSQLTYTLTNLPTLGILKLNNNPLALNAEFTQEAINNNALSYTHNGSETISDSFSFTLTDGTNALTNTTFGITINPVNDVPVLVNAIAPQSTTEGQVFAYTFSENTFSDNDLNEVLTYTATLGNGNPLPSWLNFNAATRTFNGIPTADSAGTLNLVVTATDTAQASVSNTFSLTILENQLLDHSPTVNQPLSNLTVNEDAANTIIDLTNIFSDIDGDAIAKTIFANSNADLVTATIVDNQLTLDYLDNQSGIANITVRGTAKSQFVDNIFTITVNSVNDAPVVQNAIADQIATEDTTFSFTIPANTFSDVDAGDTLTYAATLENGNALPTWLTFNAATRVFSGTPANNDVATLSIKLIGTDNFDASVSDTFSLTVANTNDVPILAVAIADQTASSNTPFSFNVPTNTFSDLDAGDSLSYTATLENGSPLPSWLTFNAANLSFTGTPSLVDIGTLNIKITATDTSNASISDSFALSITNFITNLIGTSGNNTITGTPNRDIIQGLGGNDTLFGLAGNDTLDGGTGIDTITGGLGDDTYIVDNSADKVVENVDEGTDTIRSSISYILGNNLENLVLTGTSKLSGTGNALNNQITGNSGSNTLNGKAGDDTMSGGLSNDIYIVDSIGDVITENADEGTDSVNSSITYTLTDNVERLTLTGTTDINGTGNELNNTITGNSGNNILTGGGGNDSLNGGTGNDTLIGGVGDDNLLGGVGNDTYTVDSSRDVVIENSNQGTDSVIASISYTLRNNVEWLTLNGTTDINGTGNSLNNSITGNSGNNTLTGNNGNDTLNGGDGNDTMLGGVGNDTYIIDSLGDVVIESANQGTDSVTASITYTLGNNVERLTLTGTANIDGTGNSLNNTITGNSGNNLLKGLGGNDILVGGDGNDILVGGAGNDLLTGGNGTDQFLFSSSVAFTTSSFGVDTITDFSQGTDKIALSKSSFIALTSAVNSNLLGSEFTIINVAVANEISIAGGSSAKIVYNSTTGNLLYNQNAASAGLGSGGIFANLKTTLDANDFLVQA